jgi:hypothetical protein
MSARRCQVAASSKGAGGSMVSEPSHAVLRFDPTYPHRMELIAIFYEAAPAQAYVRLHALAEEHQKKKQHSVRQAAKRAPKRSANGNDCHDPCRAD